MATVHLGLVGILPDRRGPTVTVPAGTLDPQAYSEVLLASLARRGGSEAQIAVAGVERPAAESCTQQPRSMARGAHGQSQYGAVQGVPATLWFLTAIGPCGGVTPLTSTAGCGKPHVRWCGRVQGRNPLRSTRSEQPSRNQMRCQFGVVVLKIA